MSDIIEDLGPIALGSRLKRLADRFLADAALILECAGLPIQPNHVGLLAALERDGALTVGEAVDRLGLSQPAVTRIVATLLELGLVRSEPDRLDGRIRRIDLSLTGRDVIARTRTEIWPRLVPAVSALCGGRERDLLEMIAIVEANMAERSMLERVSEDLVILPWAPERAQAFHDINAAWIEEMFTLEPHDREVLENPQQFIIDRGGDILFASSRELGIVGACALMPAGDGGVELTKMGVLASARGRKVGEVLLAAVLKRAGEMPCDPLFLLTNWKCAPAIHLYEKLGFRHDDEIMQRYGAAYARCDVAMRFVPRAAD
jgi:DNA-binding MarR family transcriptional regulator/N-acetylglutamate synthase-like GNAT family acetyltransferase